jgi:HNH endonuclease
MTDEPKAPSEQLAELAPMFVKESVFTLPNDGTIECELHEYHSPEVTSFDVHHVIPQAAGGPDTEENKVVICPTGHRNVHNLIRLLAKIGPDDIDQTDWGRKTWDMGYAGWQGSKK